jgi:hypothetical protein
VRRSVSASRGRLTLARAARLSVVVVAATTALGPSAAQAFEPFKIKKEPVVVDLTNTFLFNYMLDNRNDAPFRPGTKVDDYRAEWIDRLNLQVHLWKFRFGLRYDLALYADQVTRAEVRPLAEKEIAERQAEGNATPSLKDYSNQYFRELHSRYLNTLYPSKLWLGFKHKGFDATLGDFYVQLGRGLVFSVRKIDELAIDTTVRGAKLSLDEKLGPVRVSATAFGGQMNPLRIDEVSGRRLHGDGSAMFFAFPETGPLKTYEFGPDSVVSVIQRPRPSYLSDTVVGGRVEVGPQEFQVGGNVSVLVRKDNSADNLQCKQRVVEACSGLPAGSYERGACEVDQLDLCDASLPTFQSGAPQVLRNQIRTFSGSVAVPKIGKGNVADAYLEVAGQQLTDGRATQLDPSGAPVRVEELWGHAVYANLNLRGGPITAALELKHYRSFFPLTGTIDTITPGFAAPEFQLVSYNNVPTVEPIYIEPIGIPNVCNTGGRVRLDAKFDKETSIFAWTGNYQSWSELNEANLKCEEKDEFRTSTWDMATGVDFFFEKGKSHFKAWVGGRLSNTAQPVASGGGGVGETDVFYREAYARYDFVKHLAGAFSLQLVGWHRNRHRPSTFSDPWQEGENYTSLLWSPYLSASFGFEYLNRLGCEPRNEEQSACFFFSGQLQYRAKGTEKTIDRLFNAVRLYFGQRRGALRCVSGVCRLFPPLEGAQVELVSRF